MLAHAAETIAGGERTRLTEWALTLVCPDPCAIVREAGRDERGGREGEGAGRDATGHSDGALTSETTDMQN